MNKQFAVSVALLCTLAASCHLAEADSLSECREKVEKFAASHPLPKELANAKELRQLLAKEADSKGGKYRLARAYYAKLDKQVQSTLYLRAHEFTSEAIVKLRALGCKRVDLDKLVNVSMDRDRISPGLMYVTQNSATRQFNRNNWLAILVYYIGYCAQHVGSKDC